MISVEAICFLLVLVGSLGLFYYLGWLAGRESALFETFMWADNDEDDEEND